MTPKKTGERAKGCGEEGAQKAHMFENIFCNITCNDRNCGMYT